MDSTHQHHPLNLWVLRLASLLGFLAALTSVCGCTPTAEPTPLPEPTLRPPTLDLGSKPQTLCGLATQIRLVVQAREAWPEELEARWVLWDGKATLHSGRWRPESGEALIGFPGGLPLSPGAYSIQLYAGEHLLNEQPFTIIDRPSQLHALEVVVTPNGDPLVRLPTGTSHFYVRYRYTGACSGAPFWVTVRHGASVVCRHNDVITRLDGDGAIACYRDDSQAFTPGTYTVEYELMGSVRQELSFEIGDPPPPATPTATPLPEPLCESPFTAAGLTPDGTPFRVTDIYEWYTQAIYVGAQCRQMWIGVPWRATWYRDSALVRSTAGEWKGPLGSTVVWDSLTGVVENPFLLPGIYTVTLEIGSLNSLTTSFRVQGYIRPEPTP